MARDLIVQLCCEFYSSDEIARSKGVLFDNVLSKYRYSKRKGDKKSRDNMNDITRVFLELDNKTPVVFVASDLANLPSLSTGNFDVLSVVQDVESLMPRSHFGNRA